MNYLFLSILLNHLLLSSSRDLSNLSCLKNIIVLSTTPAVASNLLSLNYPNNVRTRNENTRYSIEEDFDDYNDDDDDTNDYYSNIYKHSTSISKKDNNSNNWIKGIFQYMFNQEDYSNEYFHIVDAIMDDDLNDEEYIEVVDDDERILYTIDDIQNWKSTYDDNKDKISAVYNITTNTVSLLEYLYINVLLIIFQTAFI